MNESKVTLRNMFPQLIQQAPAVVDQIMKATAYRVQATSQQSMQGTKSGRTYRRGRNRLHRASAPGQAPAIDTGMLVNAHAVRQVGPMRYRIEVSTEYALPLEFGTGRMAARPFLRPAVEKEYFDMVGELRHLEGKL